MFTRYITFFYCLHDNCINSFDPKVLQFRRTTTHTKFPKTTTCSGTRVFPILHAVFDMMFLAFLRSLNSECKT